MHFKNDLAGASQMNACTLKKCVVPLTVKPFVSISLNSVTNSCKNSAIFLSLSFTQNIPMTKGVEEAICYTKHNIDHNTVVELLNKGKPSTLNCNSRTISGLC